MKETKYEPAARFPIAYAPWPSVETMPELSPVRGAP